MKNHALISIVTSGTWALLLALFAANGPVHAQERYRMPPRFHGPATACVDHLFGEDFAAARAEALGMIAQHPDEPAGYFFAAMVLLGTMEYEGSWAREDDFLLACATARARAEARLDNHPGDYWSRFFVGCTDGIIARYHLKTGHWLRALGYGRRGAHELWLLHREHRDAADLHYGIGSYRYWQSRMRTPLRSPASMREHTEDALAMLRHASKHGVYFTGLAAKELVDAYAGLGRHAAALKAARDLLGSYPENTALCLAEARACLHRGNYWTAEHVLRPVLARATAATHCCAHLTAACHLCLATAYMRTGRYVEAVAQCRNVELLSRANEGAPLQQLLRQASALEQEARARSERVGSTGVEEDQIAATGE
jgi:tetratricopeptide (TPR) repeat protein